MIYSICHHGTSSTITYHHKPTDIACHEPSLLLPFVLLIRPSIEGSDPSTNNSPSAKRISTNRELILLSIVARKCQQLVFTARCGNNGTSATLLGSAQLARNHHAHFARRLLAVLCRRLFILVSRWVHCLAISRLPLGIFPETRIHHHCRSSNNNKSSSNNNNNNKTTVKSLMSTSPPPNSKKRKTDQLAA